MESEKFGLEQSMDQILKGYNEAWRSYKEHLTFVFSFLKNQANYGIDIVEGNSFIRFNLTNDESNLGKFYFLCEIGDVFPRFRWRNFVVLSSEFKLFPFQKKVSYFPVYSYSFDKLFTLVYWGEKQFFLNIDHLNNLDLKNFLFTVSNPSNMSISAANFIWLMKSSLEKEYINSELFSNLSRMYIYNTLFPPNLTGIYDIWSESPFIVVGNKRLDIYTLHKTVCYLHLDKRLNFQMNSFIKVKVLMLDKKLGISQTYCLVPEDSLSLFEKEPITSALLIKHVKILSQEFSRSPVFDIRLYPIGSEELFGSSISEVLITILSIVLRYQYLNSSDPIRLSINLKDIISKVLNILSLGPFKKYRSDTFISNILSQERGLDFVMHHLLGIYHNINKDIFYLHPSLIESLSLLYEDYKEIFNMKIEDLKDLILKCVDMLNYIRGISKEKYGIKDLISIKGIVEKKFGFDISFDVLNRFIYSLKLISNSIIPISKFFYTRAVSKSYFDIGTEK